MFTEFIVEVRIEHVDYQIYQGYQRLSVSGQELSLIFEILGQEAVPSTGTAKIRVYIKNVDGELISGAARAATACPICAIRESIKRISEYSADIAELTIDRVYKK